MQKQRLLYLQVRSPSVFSDIIGFTPIEPTEGYQAEIQVNVEDWPYESVHQALTDGWRIIQFPHLQAPIDDRDLDVVGYEFIMEKWEEYP